MENNVRFPQLRVGCGYDVHKLVEERKLILCGVEVPYELGLLGHSDADVALHALMDALLGAAALGDIGKHFPDTDERFKGADSMKLTEHVAGLLAERGWQINNVDVTIIAQRPKLASFIPAMRANVARVLGVEEEAVNVKATTTEKLGFTGRGEGIASEAVASIIRL
ncbi:2-C-methyl-D-erythritol 2,4-cyclodiphosphate synthase [uncultured Phascolarctobacterium sp.]|uniref:2-C-methyl-D-erythritol 2,4-cyclodiphosphate synthase n=1 Tax=uncultured Phascolarctobacterium sp. TaxID=512296 RepID=UPI0025D2EFEA|nr:2-C-methyl-D-erythritol 2,4-cyclodiphosphate synthase [uncultured Phascolarctobacterium sp.]